MFDHLIDESGTELKQYAKSSDEATEEVNGDKYRHYKGTVYQLIGFGKHTETEEEFATYRDINGNIWIRPKEMFNGTVNFKGKTIQRFTHIE